MQHFFRTACLHGGQKHGRASDAEHVVDAHGATFLRVAWRGTMAEIQTAEFVVRYAKTEKLWNTQTVKMMC